MLKTNIFDRIPDSKIKFFTQKLLEWFNCNARDFSWRRESDPYKILLAEIMLQRTKAEQVYPVYIDFISEFNRIDLLKNVNVISIIKYIKKLGLLWRSKKLLEMSNYIIENCHGEIPQTKEELLKIPGIGNYIADALLVFAFNKRKTVIDSNVIRVTSRFFGLNLHGEVRRNRKFIEFCQTLCNNLDGSEIKNFNWGLIDFSYLICKPVPKCNTCPLAKKCNFFNNNIEKIDIIKK